MSAPALRIVCTFQSTLPLRGATGSELDRQQTVGISIHAPLAGSDVEAHNAATR